MTPLTVYLSSEKVQNPARKHFEKTNTKSSNRCAMNNKYNTAEYISVKTHATFTQRCGGEFSSNAPGWIWTHGLGIRQPVPQTVTMLSHHLSSLWKGHLWHFAPWNTCGAKSFGNSFIMLRVSYSIVSQTLPWECSHHSTSDNTSFSIFTLHTKTGGGEKSPVFYGLKFLAQRIAEFHSFCLSGRVKRNNHETVCRQMHVICVLFDMIHLSSTVCPHCCV